MKITNCTSPSFNGIKVQKSKMNWLQKGISNRLSRSIEYCDKYAELTKEGADIDIYMLPVKKGVEVRLVDLYSENFIKNQDGNIFKMLVDEYGSFEKAADKIIDMYEKVTKGIVKRPEENFEDYIKGNTDVARLNPKEHDIEWLIKSEMQDGATKAAAEEFAYESHISTVREYNKDGEF